MNIELNNRNDDKFVPHPVLDNPEKMMRIIANPVYDKLTISRAAHIKKYNRNEYTCQSARINRSSKQKPITTPVKSLNTEQTITTPLPTNNNQSQLKSTIKRQNSLPFHLPTPLLTDRNIKSSVAPIRTQSFQSPLIDNKNKSSKNGTIRYMDTRHGFEIQRYSSYNWLSIDLLNKELCKTEDKTFLEMLSKKEQDELLSRSIYTSEYYRKRLYDLLQSYKQGNLTHKQWAKQNYQLNCLKTFYIQAFKREQSRFDLHAKKLRQKRAQSAFNQWKENKDEEILERHRSFLNTANSQQTTEITPDPSLNYPNNIINRMSISSIMDNELEELPISRAMNSSKNTTVSSNPLYMLDKQRWSLGAMLKRVVGLAEPLPPPPKITNYQHSSLTNLSNDSGFESGV